MNRFYSCKLIYIAGAAVFCVFLWGFQKSDFQLFFTPTLKGETSENRLSISGIMQKNPGFVRAILLSDYIVYGDIVSTEGAYFFLKKKEIYKGQLSEDTLTVLKETPCKGCSVYKTGDDVIVFLFKNENGFSVPPEKGKIIYVKDNYCYSVLFKKESLSMVRDALININQCFSYEQDKETNKAKINIICPESELENFAQHSAFHGFIVNSATHE